MTRKLYTIIVQRQDGSAVDTLVLSDDSENVFLYTSLAVLEKASHAVNKGTIGRINTETGFKFYLTVGDIQYELKPGDALVLGSDGEFYPLLKTLLHDVFNVKSVV